MYVRTSFVRIVSILLGITMFYTQTHAKQKTNTQFKNTTVQEPIEKPIEKPKERSRNNAWVWAGAGFLFGADSFSTYTSQPMMDYQIGMAKSIWNVTSYDFWYVAFIFDYAY